MDKAWTDAGLSAAVAAERLRSEGCNELPAPDRRGYLRIIAEVVRQPMLLLLMGGGAVYFLLGDHVEALLLLGLPLILAPIHIAFLEMVIDPACSVVLEAEEEEDDVMQRPPRDADSRLLLPGRLLWALLQGFIVFAILAGVFITAARLGMPEADLRALVFTCLVLVNMGLILVNRSFSASLVRAFRRPNRSLWILLGGVSMVLALALFWPPAQALFHFGPLHVDDLAIGLAAGFMSLILLEAIKARWFRADAVVKST